MAWPLVEAFAGWCVEALAHFSCFSLPAMTHSLIVLSWLPDASVFPSGLYATDSTQPVCPLRVACFLPVATSNSLVVLFLSPNPASCGWAESLFLHSAYGYEMALRVRNR